MNTATLEPRAPDPPTDPPGESPTARMAVPDREVLDTMSPHDLVVLFQELEQQRRTVEAALVEVTAAAAARDLPRADGHRSPKGWCMTLAGWSGGESLERVRTGRLARADELFAEAMHSGRLGVAHGHRLGRAHANPRCGDQLSDVMEMMLTEAETMPYDDFRLLVDRWEMLADADGAHRDANATHARRNAAFTDVGLSGRLLATGCTSSTAAMAEILDAFVQAEWATDWAAARREHGAQATVSHLARTDAQRRFDALQRIFERAAGSPTDGGPAVTVNYMIDDATVARLLGRTDDQGTGSVADASGPLDPRRMRCETVTGTVVPPATILEAMWWGHIRRVVVDAASVPIDLGRRQRLFTGAARDAIMLMAARCVNPGVSGSRHPLSGQPPARLATPRAHRSTQRWPRVRPPQSAPQPRVQRPTRHCRPVAHVPARRHRDHRAAGALNTPVTEPGRRSRAVRIVSVDDRHRAAGRPRSPRRDPVTRAPTRPR